MPNATPSSGRPYHHGRLREALVSAGVELARDGGAEAVSLRAVTREVGVSAAAAYRHFADHDALLADVGIAALAGLARAIEAHQAAITSTAGPERAVELLQAVGDGYIDSALKEPRLFEVAMFGLPTLDEAHHRGAAGETGRTAYELLSDAVAALIEEGLIPAERGQQVATLCWSTVHGFATLAVQGPLRRLPVEELTWAGRDVVRAVTAGLAP